MKPCSPNRKLIAWLALDALEPQQARELRAHIQTCDGCRQYLRDVSGVTQTLSSARRTSDAQVPAPFKHQKLAATLQAARPLTRWANLLAQLRDTVPEWHMALPVFSGITIVILVLSVIVRHPGASSVAPPVVSGTPRLAQQSSTAPTLNPVLPPTAGNYLMVANRSLDQFDDLLTRQATRHPLPTSVDTASILAHPNLSD
jgi:hypothetical protein